jgi:hypothetical protein
VGFPRSQLPFSRLLRRGAVGYVGQRGRRFDPSSSPSSQAFLRSARLLKRRENEPEIRAFSAFALVSGLPVCRAGGGDRRKSPAFPANIPVLEKLWTETRLITTAARGRQSILGTDKVSEHANRP